MYLPEKWLDNLSEKLKDIFYGMIGISMVLGLWAIPLDIILGDKLSDEAKNAFKNNSSLNNLDPINQKLHTYVDKDKLAASNIHFQVAAVSLESGQVHYIEKTNQAGKGLIIGDGSLVDIYDAVFGSASQPVIFKPIFMGGQHFVDGGLREQVPIKNTIDMGADKVFAIQPCTKGNINWRGSLFFSTSSTGKLASLNNLIAVFEAIIDPEGNFSEKTWEWK